MTETTTSSPWDELRTEQGDARPAAAEVLALVDRLGVEDLQARQAAAATDILTMGITFTVYSDGTGIDRAWPFDVIPRIIEATEWSRIERGLIQRLHALNLFIDDVYNERRVVADGVFPIDLLEDSVNYRAECEGVHPKHGVWAHISGSDLVRDSDGTMYVLEDNLRVPSGVSYVLENRAVAKRAFPEVFARQSIAPVDAYTDELNKLLVSLAPDGISDPSIAVLTPGIFNSAYFEHAFLAQRMGATLVEGGDLTVSDDDRVFMRTIGGLEPVDVIYRRIDDLFLDPEAFRPDSTLGVPGLMRAWKAGKVAIANAPGAGVADDKVVYAWVPDLIRYYLDEEPLLPNVPTYRCLYEDERRFVLDNLRELVLKPANESGGYGILIGNRATPAQLEAQVEAIESDPRNWVAQPILQLSTAPTLCGDTIEPRHVDLRPFILTGATSYVTAGGLTRVALPKGSLVVNSSQGGGSKDTWIVDLGRQLGQLLMLLSRVADRLYWAARYIERAEDTARLVRAHGELVADLPPQIKTQWEPLVAVVGSGVRFRDMVDGDAPQQQQQRQRQGPPEPPDDVEMTVARFLVTDRENPSSVVSCVMSARENLRTTRDTVPREGWHALNDLYLYVTTESDRGADRRVRERFLSRVISDGRRLDGVLATSMTHDEAYVMWRLGRALERADMTTRVLGVRAAAVLSQPARNGDGPEGGGHDEVQWMGVLRSVWGLQMYQRAVRGPIEGSSVVHFLLEHDRFPRAVRALLREMRRALGELPDPDGPLDAVDHVEAVLRDSATATNDGVALDEAMDRLQVAIAQLDKRITDRYLRMGS